MEPSTQETPSERAVASATEARAFLAQLHAGFSAGTLAPYLGPGIAALYADRALPGSYVELAEFFGKRVALPKRARGNPWASAQYVEGQRHRGSVTKLMAEAFRARLTPGPLHRYLAGLALPLIVDTWYDGAMREALSSRSDWLELQGITRAGIGEFRWYRAYTPRGDELPLNAASAARTLLYKPHGSCSPADNYLISDADYVEVLTEIDIQTPIPELVRERRSALGFVFLGCRFHDQLLRNYARQILKRSAGPHYALLDPTTPTTRNEARFLEELGVRTLVLPLASACEQLAAHARS
jgi:hypothetical protein